MCGVKKELEATRKKRSRHGTRELRVPLRDRGLALSLCFVHPREGQDVVSGMTPVKAGPTHISRALER